MGNEQIGPCGGPNEPACPAQPALQSTEGIESNEAQDVPEEELDSAERSVYSCIHERQNGEDTEGTHGGAETVGCACHAVGIRAASG